MGKMSISQRILIIVGFVSLGLFIGIFILPVFSLGVLVILNKFLGSKMDPTYAIAIPFIWVPLLGTILGIIFGIRFAIANIKKYNKG